MSFVGASPILHAPLLFKQPGKRVSFSGSYPGPWQQQIQSSQVQTRFSYQQSPPVLRQSIVSAMPIRPFPADEWQMRQAQDQQYWTFLAQQYGTFKHTTQPDRKREVLQRILPALSNFTGFYAVSNIPVDTIDQRKTIAYTLLAECLKSNVIQPQQHMPLGLVKLLGQIEQHMRSTNERVKASAIRAWGAAVEKDAIPHNRLRSRETAILERPIAQTDKPQLAAIAMNAWAEAIQARMIRKGDISSSVLQHILNSMKSEDQPQLAAAAFQAWGKAIEAKAITSISPETQAVMEQAMLLQTGPRPNHNESLKSNNAIQAWRLGVEAGVIKGLRSDKVADHLEEAAYSLDTSRRTTALNAYGSAVEAGFIKSVKPSMLKFLQAQLQQVDKVSDSRLGKALFGTWEKLVAANLMKTGNVENKTLAAIQKQIFSDVSPNRNDALNAWEMGTTVGLIFTQPKNGPLIIRSELPFLEDRLNPKLIEKLDKEGQTALAVRLIKAWQEFQSSLLVKESPENRKAIRRLSQNAQASSIRAAAKEAMEHLKISSTASQPASPKLSERKLSSHKQAPEPQQWGDPGSGRYENSGLWIPPVG